MPATCTSMSVAPAITWLFVRTSPDAVSTMPVPAAMPFESVVVMSTIAGSTLAAMAATSLLLVMELDDEAASAGTARSGTAPITPAATIPRRAQCRRVRPCSTPLACSFISVPPFVMS